MQAQVIGLADGDWSYALAAPTVSVIGLGKLGIPTSACLASVGYTVIGVDVDQGIVDAINEGKSPIYEPGVQELLDGTRGMFVATTDIDGAIRQSEVTFIIVPTPSGEDWKFSTQYIEQVIRHIGWVLRDKKYHVISLISTVMPGASRKMIALLEEISGKECGEDFGFCYNPEFVALGTVVRNWQNPDLVLIGDSDLRAGDILEEIYRQSCHNNPPIVRLDIIDAEIMKLALNVYLVTKISYANMLGQICEQFPGANVDAITNALGLDSRIGNKYLRSGGLAGGACLPRDVRALMAQTTEIGVGSALPRVINGLNSGETYRLASLVRKHLPEMGTTVGILGLSFKAGTDVIDESPGLLLAQHLSKSSDFKTVVYDPAAMENARKVLGDAVEYAESLEEFAACSEIIIIPTMWEEFKELPVWLRSGHVVIDVWRFLDLGEIPPEVRYIPLGVGLSYDQICRCCLK